MAGKEPRGRTKGWEEALIVSECFGLCPLLESMFK